MKILVVEDTIEIVEALRYTLQLRWPQATLVSTSIGEAGVELARNEQPDVIILDLGLPDITGFEVLHRIRSFSDVPVIVLTVRGDEIDKIQGFEMGADDYIVKPFSPGELLARVGALLRRRGVILHERGRSIVGPFIKGRLSVDFISNEIRVGDEQLKLSPTQVEILHVLLDNENKVVSRQELMEKIGETNAQYVDLCVERLKDILEKKLDRLVLIVQKDGEGYRFIG